MLWWKSKGGLVFPFHVMTVLKATRALSCHDYQSPKSKSMSLSLYRTKKTKEEVVNKKRVGGIREWQHVFRSRSLDTQQPNLTAAIPCFYLPAEQEV
jgi:hypothetical protein